MVVSEIQKGIDSIYEGLNLSEDRRAVLQPLIEKQIQISRRDAADGNYGFDLTIVDKDGKKRDGVKLADLVKEVHEKASDDSIPMVENKNLTDEQLKLISEGKLGLKPEKVKPDKDALSQKEVLEQRPKLEDVATGKVKIDINS